MSRNVIFKAALLKSLPKLTLKDSTFKLQTTILYLFEIIAIDSKGHRYRYDLEINQQTLLTFY